MSDDPSSLASATWACPECGWENEATPTCGRCGLARAWLEDPPLDLPPPPGWFERPATWLALLHAAGALGGIVLWVRPGIAPFLALGDPWQWIQVALSAAAAVTSVNRAAMERLFHEIRLVVPPHAQTDTPFDVELVLIPYRRVPDVSIRIDLVENTYRRSPGRSDRLALRSERLARHSIQSGAPLRGRRVHHVETTFTAPLPNMDVHDTLAEIQASLLAPFAWLVPGLGEAARNLREHGGVRVRASVHAGPYRRVLERRIVIYMLGTDRLLAG